MTRQQVIMKRLGRRGAVLALLGVVWIGTGVAVIESATVIIPGAFPLLAVAPTFAGTMWVATGALASPPPVTSS